MGLLDEIRCADVCFATAPVGIKKMGRIAALLAEGGKRGKQKSHVNCQ